MNKMAELPLFISRDLGTTHYLDQFLSIQIFLATIFAMKTNQASRPFSTKAEKNNMLVKKIK